MRHIQFNDPIYHTEIDRRAFKYLVGCQNLTPETAAWEIEKAHRREAARQQRIAARETQRPGHRAIFIAVANKQWESLVAKETQFRVPPASVVEWRTAA